MIFYIYFLFLPVFLSSLPTIPSPSQHIFRTLKYPFKTDLSFSQKSQDPAPLIGILTQPSSWVSLYDSGEFSYIAASYIKAIEASGAQVIPIKYDWDDAKFQEVFEGLNGLLLPGGGTDLVQEGNESIQLTPYGEVGKKLLKMAMDINDNGVYFPVWGTCLGFELMILAVTEDLRVLEDGFVSLNYSNSLSFLEVIFWFYWV